MRGFARDTFLHDSEMEIKHVLNGMNWMALLVGGPAPPELLVFVVFGLKASFLADGSTEELPDVVFTAWYDVMKQPFILVAVRDIDTSMVEYVFAFSGSRMNAIVFFPLPVWEECGRFSWSQGRTFGG